MKRKIILSIALILCVVALALVKSDSTVNAEPPQRFSWDTGVVKLGSNQILRITINTGSGDDATAVRFRGLEYMQSGCSDGVCKSAVAAQNNPTPLQLMPGEAASYDLGDTGTHEVRGTVVSNSRNARVTATVLDAATQEVVGFIVAVLEQEDL